MELRRRLILLHGSVRVPHDLDAVLQLQADVVSEGSREVGLPKRQGAIHFLVVVVEVFQALQETASTIQKVFGCAAAAAGSRRDGRVRRGEEGLELDGRGVGLGSLLVVEGGVGKELLKTY